MLDYARQHAVEALSIPRTAVLATSGPAGVQASEFPCEAIGLDVYLLLPRTSDHLYNLEENPAVTLLTNLWELSGKAAILGPEWLDLELSLSRAPGVEWCVVVHVTPRKIQIRRNEGWGNTETIDIP